MRHALRPLVVVTALFGAACGGPNAASQLAHPPEWKPAGQTKCHVERSQGRPLIVEWPSPDRGALEAQAKKGLVAVRYSGCEMEVLRQCQVPGTYAYTPVTRKVDHLSIKNADELYASIPVHAAQFEAKLKQSGELDVNMTIVGSYDADRSAVGVDELRGNCKDATHFIAAITTGAFEFSAGAAAKVGGGASIGGLGAGSESSAEREVLNRDGYKAACERATGSDKSPPDGCGALLRVEVVPLGATAAPQPAVAGVLATVTIEQEPPPPPSTARTLGTIGVAGGLLGLTTWGVTGLIALLEKGNLSSACPNGVCRPSESGTLSAYRAMNTVATISLIAGSTLLTGGIVLLAVAPSAPEKNKPGMTLGLGPSGVSGSF